MILLRILFLMGVIALFAAACTTAPATDTSAAFLEAMSEADTADNPYASDAVYGDLLEQTSLTDGQRAQVLYARGSLRRQAGNDRRGAVEDFEALLELAPDDELASRARTELDFTRKDIAAIETSLTSVLTLRDWFDKVWVLGEREVPVARMQRSRLKPSAEQVIQLRQTGFVCGEDGDGGPVYQLGDRRADLDGLTWCRVVTVSP